VYRIYGHNGEVLYVGITDNLRNRLRQHHSKPWGRYASHVEWDLWADRADAEREEFRLIRLHRPPHNIIDNEDDHHVLPPPRRTACGR
jgi:excinuclease ABC subunit C